MGGKHSDDTGSDAFLNSLSGIDSDSIARLSWWYVLAGHNDSASMCYSYITNRFTAHGMPQSEVKAAIYSHAMLGQQYQFEYFDYPAAYVNLRKAEELSRERSGGYMLWSIRSLTSSLYRTCGQLSHNPGLEARALTMMKADFDSCLQAGAAREMLSIFQNMASIALADDSISAIEPQLKAYETSQLGDSLPQGAFCREYAKALRAYQDQRWNEAAAVFDRMAAILPPGVDTARYRVMIMSGKANVYHRSGNYEALFRTLDEAEEASRRDSIFDVESYISKGYAQAYEVMGDSLRAKDWWLRYYRQEQERHPSSEIDLQNLETRYQLGETTQKIKWLFAEQRRNRTMLVMVSILLVMSLAFIGYYVHNVRKQRRQQQYLYLLNRNLLRREDQILLTTPPDEEPQPGKYAQSTLSETDKRELMDKINRVMRTSAEVFSEGFRIENLASLVKTSTRNVSQVINELAGCNFNLMIQEVRIKEACRRMETPGIGDRFTTESIGRDVGFKSRTNFIAAFKRVTGLTPAQYMRQQRQHPVA